MRPGVFEFFLRCVWGDYPPPPSFITLYQKGYFLLTKQVSNEMLLGYFILLK